MKKTLVFNFFSLFLSLPSVPSVFSVFSVVAALCPLCPQWLQFSVVAALVGQTCGRKGYRAAPRDINSHVFNFFRAKTPVVGELQLRPILPHRTCK